MSADFIDSNVFVYLFDETDSAKRESAMGLVRRALASGDAAISFQVVQEVLNVVTGKLTVPLEEEDVKDFLDEVLSPLWRIMPSQDLYHSALDLRGRYRYSFYDSLILAAALEAGCKRVYSEDLQDGQRIENLTIVNPFAGS